MFPKVVQVIPMKDYSVYVYFEDGKIVNYDMSQMIEKEVFCFLKEIEIFLDRCTVMNDTLAWDISGKWDDTDYLDIDPDTFIQVSLLKPLMHLLSYVFQYNKRDCHFISKGEIDRIKKMCSEMGAGVNESFFML